MVEEMRYPPELPELDLIPYSGRYLRLFGHRSCSNHCAPSLIAIDEEAVQQSALPINLLDGE